MEKVSDMLELKGKVAVVTGAVQWLGRDMAEALAEYGADIIITSRQKEKAEKAAAEIAASFGVDAAGAALDVTDAKSVEAFAREAFAFKNRIDILINNSGGGSGASQGDLLKRSYGDIKRMIDTNLTGMLYVCKAVAPYMVRQRSGSIINIGSVAGLVGRSRDMYHRSDKMEQPVDYAAAKGGVISATRDLAGYLCQYGIRVNSISPGGFDKGDLPDEFLRLYGERTMLGAMGVMGKEIKGAALYLASDASSYVTGHNLVVDGGFSVWK